VRSRSYGSSFSSNLTLLTSRAFGVPGYDLVRFLPVDIFEALESYNNTLLLGLPLELAIGLWLFFLLFFYEDLDLIDPFTPYLIPVLPL